MRPSAAAVRADSSPPESADSPASPGGEVLSGQLAGHDYLLAVDGDRRFSGEPVAGQPALEPCVGVVGRGQVGLLPAAATAEAAAPTAGSAVAVPVAATPAVTESGPAVLFVHSLLSHR